MPDDWRNVHAASAITVHPDAGEPVDLQTYLDGLGGGDVTVTWADVEGKPATFPPTVGTTAATAAAGNHTHPTYATTAALDALVTRVTALETAAGA